MAKKLVWVNIFNENKDKKCGEYLLIGEYPDMNSLLDNCFIDGIKFREIIMADDTEILGKD